MSHIAESIWLYLVCSDYWVNLLKPLFSCVLTIYSIPYFQDLKLLGSIFLSFSQVCACRFIFDMCRSGGLGQVW